MVAYMVGRIHVTDLDKYRANYVPASTAAIAKFGGRFVARGGRTVTLEGRPVDERVVVVEWPDVERAQAWYASPEYQAARAARQGIADAQIIVTEGLPAADQVVSANSRSSV